MLKTEVIDSTKFGVQYNARDTNCNVMVLQVGKWPMYGHLLDRSMKRFPSAKIPCKRFLSSGYFYTQKRMTTSAILVSAHFHYCNESHLKNYALKTPLAVL